MPIRRSFDLARALPPLLVLLAVLAVHWVLATRAIADLAGNAGRVRTATAQAWRTVIIIAAVVGPLAYFAYGSLDGG